MAESEASFVTRMTLLTDAGHQRNGIERCHQRIDLGRTGCLLRDDDDGIALWLDTVTAYRLCYQALVVCPWLSKFDISRAVTATRTSLLPGAQRGRAAR
jgi:hypothetical protein